MVIANWKMNKTFEDAVDLVLALNQTLDPDAVRDGRVALCPPAPYLGLFPEMVKDGIALGAQDVSRHEAGAYTGDVSAAILSSLGVRYVLVGHSERRAHGGETDDDVAAKVDRALAHDLTPVVCMGEPEAIRAAGDHEPYVTDQLHAALFHLDADAVASCILAYEPIWAIGTGRTATPDDANALHGALRSTLDTRFGQTVAESMTILYGGSVKPHNAAELFACRHIDGGLVGGASLQADDFAAIVHHLRA